MSALSDYLEVNLIKHLFRTGSYTKPTILAVSLHTANPADTGAGAEVSETDTGYTRVDTPPLDANWDATSGTDGHTSNTADITFPTPTGGTNWGVITHFGIWDAMTTGNLLVYGALTTPKTVNQGDPAPKFLAGALDITLA
jgi:hypothetical protein